MQTKTKNIEFLINKLSALMPHSAQQQTGIMAKKLPVFDV